MVDTVAFVGCGAAKRDEPCAARDMYTSPFFILKRRYAEQFDDWYILSAKHGLLDPDEVIEPYDQSIEDVDTATWSAQVEKHIDELEAEQHVFLCGRNYWEPLDVPGETPLTDAGDMFDQMSWLSDQT